MRFPDGALTFEQLAQRGDSVAGRRGDAAGGGVGEPSLETCVAVVGGLLAGAALVPLNPRLGAASWRTCCGQRPGCAAGAERRWLAGVVDKRCPRSRSEPGGRGRLAARRAGARGPGLVIYTAALPALRRARAEPEARIAANLDALAQVWEWTADDLLVHALPLFHAHGLVLGMLGPLRLGRPAAPPRRLLSRGHRRRVRDRRDDAVRRADDVPPSRRGSRRPA